MGQDRRDISLIGAGVVGTTMAVCAGRAGYRIVALASRSPESARKAARLISGDTPAPPAPPANPATPANPAPPAPPATPEICSIVQAAEMADMVLLAVPDDAIAPLAAELAIAARIRPGQVFVHFSGALGSDVLRPLAEKGALTASLHPMQTFPSVLVAIDSLAGSYCFCEGEPAALTEAMQLAGDLGCIPVELESDRKALYHAAACMACNYLATLQEAAIATAILAGVGEEPARKAITPLVAATVKNISDTGPAQSLTGPIARGDVKTVAAHLQALDATAPDLAQLYRQLGRRTVRLSIKGGKIDESTADRLMVILTD